MSKFPRPGLPRLDLIRRTQVCLADLMAILDRPNQVVTEQREKTSKYPSIEEWINELSRDVPVEADGTSGKNQEADPAEFERDDAALEAANTDASNLLKELFASAGRVLAYVGVRGDDRAAITLLLNHGNDEGLSSNNPPRWIFGKDMKSIIRRATWSEGVEPKVVAAGAALHRLAMVVAGGTHTASPNQKNPPRKILAPPKKRGRPKDTDLQLDQRIYAAWDTGQYKTYADLARELKMDRRQVAGAIDRQRKRVGVRRNK